MAPFSRGSTSCARLNAAQPCQTVPTVTPGAEVLLHVDGWPKVERMLQLIDAIEARGIDPIDVSLDHWRHVHNRLTVGETPRAYGPRQPSRLSPASEDRRMTRLSYAVITTAAVSLIGVASIASFAPTPDLERVRQHAGRLLHDRRCGRGRT